MRRYPQLLVSAVVVLGALGAIGALDGCSAILKPEPQDGRWIHRDATTQRYSIDAPQVRRGALLDELKTITQAEVRPQPDRGALVTAKANGLDLEALVSLLLPAGTRPTIRHGARDSVAVLPSAEQRKEGQPLRPADGLAVKPDVAVESQTALTRTGTLKAATEISAAQAPREISGSRTKPQAATLLRTGENTAPKRPLPMRVERATVRLTLQFEEGVAPRLIDAQTLEGRAPAQRFVTGTFLYAVLAADGRLLEFGTFQDPLLEHSYLAEGTHSVGRAKSGVAGISIARANLSDARLQIVDMTSMPLPRELDEKVVRSAIERGTITLRLDTATILRRLDQETKK